MRVSQEVALKLSETYASMTPPWAESGMEKLAVAAVVVEDGAEEVVVVLAEGVEAGLDGVARDCAVKIACAPP